MQKKSRRSCQKCVSCGCRSRPRGSPCTVTSCKMTAAQSPARSFDPCIIHYKHLGMTCSGPTPWLGHPWNPGGDMRKSKSTVSHSLTYHGGGLHFKFWEFVPALACKPPARIGHWIVGGVGGCERWVFWPPPPSPATTGFESLGRCFWPQLTVSKIGS